MQPVCPVLVTGMHRSASLSYRCRLVAYPVPKTGTQMQKLHKLGLAFCSSLQSLPETFGELQQLRRSI
jgi:hypothetical protein